MAWLCPELAAPVIAMRLGSYIAKLIVTRLRAVAPNQHAGDRSIPGSED